MTQINPNIKNSYTQQAFKAQNAQIPMQYPEQEIQESQVQLPDIYYYPTTSEEPIDWKEDLKKKDAMNIVTPWVENPILTGATCLGVFKGFDLLSKNFGGEYESSLVGKAANLGDRIQNSKLIQSNTSQKILKPIKTFWDKAKTFANNNSILSAIFNTPARPDWEMPRSEMQSMQARTVQEFKEFASKVGLTASEDSSFFGLLKTSDSVKLKNLALNNDEKDAVLQFFKIDKLSKGNCDNIINFVRLKRLGLDDTNITNILHDSNASEKVKAEILKVMKLTDAEFEEIMKDTTGKTAKKLEEALANAKGKLIASSGNHKLFGNFQPLKRTLTGEQYFNRLHSISSAKTTLGRIGAKSMQVLHRMATFGGGKLGLLIFMIPSIVQTIKNTKKADSDSKVGTLANGLLTSVAWVVTFPLAVKTLFSLGGLKNIGNSKANVEKIKEITDQFNNAVQNGAFDTKESFDTARKLAQEEIKKLKPKGGNLIEKILRKAGSFLDIGNGNLVGRKFFSQKLPHLGKNIIGVPLRFAAGMWLATSVFDGTLVKICKSIFGNYYDEYKENEQVEKKKKQKEFTKQDLQNRMIELQASKMNAVNNQAVNETEQTNSNPVQIESEVPTQIAQEPESSVPKESTETIAENNKTKNSDSYDYIPSQNSTIKNSNSGDNYTYIPSQENVFNQNNPAEQEKYIPSQNGAKFTKTFDNSGLQGALKRADSAEKKAIEVLSGKFDN